MKDGKIGFREYEFNLALARKTITFSILSENDTLINLQNIMFGVLKHTWDVDV